MKALTYIKNKKNPLSNFYNVFLQLNRSNVKEDYETRNLKFPDKK